MPCVHCVCVCACVRARRSACCACTVQAAEGSKVPWGKKRGDRTGLPPLEKLPDIQCCDGLCGRTISPEAYIYHWSNFSNAASEEEADHTLARVLSPRLCGRS